MLKPNLICERGHTAYSPTPLHWVTQSSVGRFCTDEKCYRRNTRVRLIGSEFQYESPLVIRPPEGVSEE